MDTDVHVAATFMLASVMRYRFHQDCVDRSRKDQWMM